MRKTIKLENIKCAGCKNQIRCHLEGLVDNLNIDTSSGKVTFDYEQDAQVIKAIENLEQLGYPEEGNSDFSHKVKSVVSCLIGRTKG